MKNSKKDLTIGQHAVEEEKKEEHQSLWNIQFVQGA